MRNGVLAVLLPSGGTFSLPCNCEETQTNGLIRDSCPKREKVNPRDLVLISNASKKLIGSSCYELVDEKRQGHSYQILPHTAALI